MNRFIIHTLMHWRYWQTMYWFCRITGDPEGEDYAEWRAHRDWWNGVIARFCRDYSCRPRKSSLEEVSWLIDKHCGNDLEALVTLIEWTQWTLERRTKEGLVQEGSE